MENYLKQFVGKELECDFDLTQGSDNTIKLLTKGKKYKILAVDRSSFLLENDAGRFDLIFITNFKIPK